MFDSETDAVNVSQKCTCSVYKHNTSYMILANSISSSLIRVIINTRSGELPPDTPQNLLSYSQQVALAMHYLSSKAFVHRDLAARNIFVTQENICKVEKAGYTSKKKV